MNQPPAVYGSMVEAMVMPRIVRLRPNLHAVVFSLMKLLPAKHIVEQARSSGLLAPGAPVLETSSGTFALGLALVCRHWGHPLTIVGDPAIDPALRTRLEMLGTRVEIVDDFDAPGGIQGARLARLEELRRALPGAFVPGQYDNPGNPGAYLPVAELIATTVGRVDRLVGPVGSGGSSGGISSALRLFGADPRVVGVDTPGSVIFGLDNGPRALRGLGSSIRPGNVVHRSYDEVHWVSAAAAFETTRRLFSERGMFVGPTSGAAHLAADWYARRDGGESTVAVFPDDGYRYQDTVYSEPWLREHGHWAPDLPEEPLLVERPEATDPHWTRIEWGRRPAPEHVSAG
ncbi:PLP-dependent cysteine synthase family protein [Nocardiopsis sp. CNT312]|uniref:PLP-dependent cysteine synthase family protein n=1 Tax=Nocardiopsis sp. CNT312 TaxID=1137268 RepID=UPI0004B867AC|nr:pyridoxal-phosphate dependent enzyme [Nocardiopsis sp. CNT312]